MTKASYTPEPWSYEVHELSEGFSAIVYDEHGRAVADHLSEDRAHLIAAAPDMYGALLAAKVVIEMMERPEGMGGRVNAALDKRLAQIDAAIAKAEGRSND